MKLLSRFSVLLFLSTLFACHCPTPFGFCAHDLQYFLFGVPFLPAFSVWIAEKVKKFHFWRHDNCAHHPKNDKCAGHDHVPMRTRFGEVKDVKALDCEEGKDENLSERNI